MAKVKARARPWRAIFALVLAAAAGIISSAAGRDFESWTGHDHAASKMVAASTAAAFCLLATVGILGLAGHPGRRPRTRPRRPRRPASKPRQPGAGQLRPRRRRRETSASARPAASRRLLPSGLVPQPHRDVRGLESGSDHLCLAGPCPAGRQVMI